MKSGIFKQYITQFPTSTYILSNVSSTLQQVAPASHNLWRYRSPTDFAHRNDTLRIAFRRPTDIHPEADRWEHNGKGAGPASPMGTIVDSNIPPCCPSTKQVQFNQRVKTSMKFSPIVALIVGLICLSQPACQMSTDAPVEPHKILVTTPIAEDVIVTKPYAADPLAVPCGYYGPGERLP